jgi:hypothetical protein
MFKDALLHVAFWNNWTSLQDRYPCAYDADGWEADHRQANGILSCNAQDAS